MTESFRIGEIAILRQPPGWPISPPGAPCVPRGSEVTIVGLLTYGPLTSNGEPAGQYSYHLIEFNGRRFGSPVEWLHKKPPPVQREELGDWDLCPWRPERVTVSEE